MMRFQTDERGQVLPAALVALALGSLLVGSFLSYVTTSLVASRVNSQSVQSQYAAGAGAEDAIWRLMYGDLTNTVLTVPGDTLDYELDDPVNGLSPDITVTRAEALVAGEDFETGDWSGGTGWLDDWHPQGPASVSSAGEPRTGTYHLVMPAECYASRAVDLTNNTNVHLQFWYKSYHFGGPDYAECVVSSNGLEWTTVRRWGKFSDDGEFHFENVDLSAFLMSDEFWIAFDANMSGLKDVLYIDDLRIVADQSPVRFEIVSATPAATIRAGTIVEDDQFTLVSWEVQ